MKVYHFHHAEALKHATFTVEHHKHVLLPRVVDFKLALSPRGGIANMLLSPCEHDRLEGQKGALLRPKALLSLYFGGVPFPFTARVLL